MATVAAPTNIAVIKYWGKADATYNTPINDSLSVTLDLADLRAVTTVAASPSFTHDRLWLNGVEDTGAAQNPRFRACIDGVKALSTRPDLCAMKIHVSSYNTFPTAAGLASSAAGYAALVAALAELLQAQESFDGELTTIARQGSGSACRSLYGGCVAWRAGSAAKEWLDSKAEMVGEWPELRALILVVSAAKKDTSSTAGMRTSVETSELLKHRAEHVVPVRMAAMEKAIQEKDFAAFGQITMQDSNQFHATCLDTYPPIFYMNDVSRTIVRLVTAYNKYTGSVKAAYTFDAGPNAVIYSLESQSVELAALFLHYFPATAAPDYLSGTTPEIVAQHTLPPDLLAACDAVANVHSPGQVQRMIATRSGPGPQVLTDECNLDPVTGLNTYTAPAK